MSIQDSGPVKERKCAHCGAINPASVDYCGACGSHIANENRVGTAYERPPGSQGYQQPAAGTQPYWNQNNQPAGYPPVPAPNPTYQPPVPNSSASSITKGCCITIPLLVAGIIGLVAIVAVCNTGSCGPVPIVLFAVMAAALPFVLIGYVIWGIVDCLTNEIDQNNQKLVWILVLILVPGIGTLLYFLYRRPLRISQYGR